MGGATAIITTGKTGKGDFVIASVPYASFDRQFAYQISKEHVPVALLLPFTKLSAAIEFGPSYSDYDPAKLIKNIHVPVFIIAAKEDRDIDYDQEANLYQLANDPKSIWSPDTRHDVHLEKPQEFQNKITTFLESLN
jgi:pimeloyl-ACP methyl ester carboxylesterase